MVVPVYRLFWD